tara:strand:+ start:1022 stop:1753 length:732 start_codon:yes stop_codon:yes gene_type:complete
MEKIEFYSPSYKRAETSITQNYLPFCKYVVAEFEAEKYIKNKKDVWVVPNEAQGSVSKIRNYILNNAESKKIVMLDDDMTRIGRWQNQKVKKLNAEEVLEFCENAFNLCDDLNIKYWGMNLLPDKGAYREYTPFSLTVPILGPFQAFNNLDLRYSESLPLKEDYDLSLQVLNKYRKTLRFNAYHYYVKQHTNIGGCADYRTLEREKAQIIAFQKKWGKQIVQEDKSSKGFDINPIVKIPIRGV